MCVCVLKEWLERVAEEAFERFLCNTHTGTKESIIGAYRWKLVERIGCVVAHANYCMLQEVQARSLTSHLSTKKLYEPVQSRGQGASPLLPNLLPLYRFPSVSSQPNLHRAER